MKTINKFVVVNCYGELEGMFSRLRDAVACRRELREATGSDFTIALWKERAD